jgi:small conductance mechanosensitive channel
MAKDQPRSTRASTHATRTGIGVKPAQQRGRGGTAGTVAFLIRLITLILAHAGGGAGQVQGTVTSIGLLYVTLANGEDRILVPNNVVLAGAVVPLREPSGVDVRARLPSNVKPSQVEKRLEQRVQVVEALDQVHTAPQVG